MPQGTSSADRYVMVSRPIADRLQPIRSLYREEPESDHDSGWRLFTGQEDDDTLEDPETMVILVEAEALALEPQLALWINHPVGTCLERAGEAGPFQESIDIPLFDTPLGKPDPEPR